MNFDRPGWLQRYLDFRSRQPFADELPSAGVKVLEGTSLHNQIDESIYYFLQPTGLLYGFPVGLPFPELAYPGGDYMSAHERVHLIFLDSLFACLVADRHFLLSGLSDEQEHLAPALTLATTFFAHPEGARARRVSGLAWPLRWSGNDNQALFEREMRARIGLSTEWLRLPGHYYNSFLFLDLYYCTQWQRRMLVDPGAAEAHLRELAEQQRRDRELLIRLMIAAAAVSGDIVRAERRLIDWFIRSSGLDRRSLAELRAALNQGLRLDELVIPELPWLVRRFMLEATLVTILVDRVLSPEEERFLEEAVDALQLWKEELTQSKLALEVFILHREKELHIFRDRPALLNATANIRGQASVVIRKNLHRLVQEIRETQELYTLLMKATHVTLTSEEKARVRQQLLDILKTIPALAVFALPGGGLILPVLIRLLPFNLLPSAFDED